MVPTLAGGGAERVFVTLARLLDRSKFDISLAVFDLAGEQFLRDLPADVNIVALKSRKVRYGLFAAVRLIWRLRPDVVLSTLNHLNTAIALTRPLWPRRVRFVARPAIANSIELEADANPLIRRMLLGIAAKWTDLFLMQSRAMEEDLLKAVWPQTPPTRVVANPLDLARVRSLAGPARPPRSAAPARFRIVAAGRLEHQKGFDLLLDTMAIVAKKFPASLTVLGEGSLRPVLQDRIERLGLRDAVSLPGYCGNPYAAFRQSDLFVLSSRYEGFPNVVIEALACGTPVVATPLPGLDALLCNIPGCRIARNISAEALADAIAAALANPTDAIREEVLAPYEGSRAVAVYEEALLDVIDRTRLRVADARVVTRAIEPPPPRSFVVM